jgi:hypothetical protein
MVVQSHMDECFIVIVNYIVLCFAKKNIVL